MTDELTTHARAEQLGRMAVANELEAYDVERQGHFGLAKALLARAEDYRKAAAEITRKLAAQIEPGEVAAFVGVCLCGAVTWVASWVLL